jgi:hypothetical protein
MASGAMLRTAAALLGCASLIGCGHYAAIVVENQGREDLIVQVEYWRGAEQLEIAGFLVPAGSRSRVWAVTQGSPGLNAILITSHDCTGSQRIDEGGALGGGIITIAEDGVVSLRQADLTPDSAPPALRSEKCQAD